jgi:hypothetical protein
MRGKAQDRELMEEGTHRRISGQWKDEHMKSMISQDADPGRIKMSGQDDQGLSIACVKVES